ncbi:MAG TPA: DUF5985 family protein [Kofleriaceae bacterium]|nr:DUF5985 family protein [Kofleriaceae bacterium]
MTHSTFAALSGALAALAVVISTFFLRYWRLSHDRLFLFFSAAFGLLAVNWGGVAVELATSELRPYLYLCRLLAFVLIATAIVDKNRRDR